MSNILLIKLEYTVNKYYSGVQTEGAQLILGFAKYCHLN